VSDERAEARDEMRREAEGLTAGPGVVASKTQARSAVAWGTAGAFAGALVGIVLGLTVFGGTVRAVVLAGIAIAVAGAVFGAVAAGTTRPAEKIRRQDSDADT
jgi:outer membrane lipoprotein SlyB